MELAIDACLRRHLLPSEYTIHKHVYESNSSPDQQDPWPQRVWVCRPTEPQERSIFSEQSVDPKTHQTKQCNTVFDAAIRRENRPSCPSCNRQNKVQPPIPTSNGAPVFNPGTFAIFISALKQPYSGFAVLCTLPGTLQRSLRCKCCASQ